MYDLSNKTVNDLMNDLLKDSMNDWMNDDSVNDLWLDLMNYVMKNPLHNTMPFGYGLRNLLNGSLKFIIVT